MAGATMGSSVLAVKFDQGVLMATDTSIYYGSMAMFRNVKRMVRVNDYTVAGCTGDHADFQKISSIIEQLQIEEEASGNDHPLSPKALHTWLTRVSYNRRSRMDPLYTKWVVGGIDPASGKSFLGFVDNLGTAYTSDTICTGYGSYFVRPRMDLLIEKKKGALPTESEARSLINEGMKVLYARDCRSWNRYHLAVVKQTAPGKFSSVIEDPVQVDCDWTLSDYTKMV